MHDRVDGATASRGLFHHSKRQLENLRGLCVHLVGIGGSGMSGAAALLRQCGAVVSGSDIVAFDGLGELVQKGVRVSIGHRQENVRADSQLVVASAAIPNDNPELLFARRHGIPIVKYAELLGLVMEAYEGVAIAGTHGKSTTSGMTVHLAQQGGLDPSFLIGARSSQLGGSGGAGQGRHFIVESCEFDRSFLHLRPRLATILNIEPDHLDCYRDLDEIVDAFAAFAMNVEPDGVLICNGDDGAALRAASRARSNVETFGFDESADWRAHDLRQQRGCYEFTVSYRGRELLRTRLSIPGKHNVENALAAIALSYHAGVAPESIASAVETFEGVDRRMTLRGVGSGVTIVDDYGHHPTEIRVTIEAALRRYEPRRLFVVFQPHQTVRTRRLMSEFASSFGGADEVLIPAVYGARESGATARTDSMELAKRICENGGKARYVNGLTAVTPMLTEQVAEGDLVLVMGAGDVWKVANELVERLCGPDTERRAPGKTDLVSPGRACEASVSAA